jgi:hypothetical protein
MSSIQSNHNGPTTTLGGAWLVWEPLQGRGAAGAGPATWVGGSQRCTRLTPGQDWACWCAEMTRARPVTLPARLLPVGKLRWPALNQEKRGEFLVDKVVLSLSGGHLVAVTNNTFWNRCHGDMI